MRRILSTTSAIALTTLPGIAAAQDVIDLGTIIVTANQTPVEESRSGVTVEVISEQELTADGTVQVVDQLSAVPGVTVAGNGPVGGVQAIFLRGRQSRYAPVYLNGIDLGDPSSVQTAFNWGGLVTAGLGRVEVLKGAQSAVFGSEAVGGVINLSSARLSEPGQELRFSAEIGSYDTVSTSFSYLQKTDRADLSLTLSHYKTDGFSAADENEVGPDAENDGYEGTTLLLSGEVQATDFLTFGGTFFMQDEEVEFDASGGATGDDPDRQSDGIRRGARLFATWDSGVIAHTFALVHSDMDRKDPNGFTTRFEGERTEVEYSGVAETSFGTLSFGIANSLEQARLSNGDNNDFEILSAWVEGQFALAENIDATVSLRGEDHSEFGSAETWRIATAWRATEATTVRFSLGTGFRAPSLFELFSSFGNADLEPEESISVDLGVEHAYDTGARVKATLFYSEIDNLIGFAGGSYNQVDGVSVSQGLELSGVFPVNDALRLTGAYTYTDSTDAEGVQLVRVPRNQFFVGVEADLTDRLSAELALHHFAGREDFDSSFQQVSVSDYSLANATFTYDINDTTDAYLRIENLLDEEYQTASGFGTSDRAAYFGIRASF